MEIGSHGTPGFQPRRLTSKVCGCATRTPRQIRAGADRGLEGDVIFDHQSHSTLITVVEELLDFWESLHIWYSRG